MKYLPGMGKTVWILVFFALMLPLSWAADTPFYVNLQNSPLYVRAGFDSAALAAPDFRPSAAKNGPWREFTQWKNVIISKINLPGEANFPRRPFLSPFGRPEQEWTIAIPFTMEQEPPAFPGIFLAAIGDNWEMYLNGTLIRREMHLDNGSEPQVRRIREHHSQRDVFFPIDRSLIIRGDNLLVFRIVGDPTDQTIGLQYSAPYYLADYEYIHQKNSENLKMILIGVFMLVGVYHFLIFAIQRESRYNGICGIFSLCMGFYFLCRTHGIYRLIPDTWIVVKLEFFFIFMALPVLAFYTETLCLRRIQTITKIYSGLCAFLALSQLFLVHSYGSDALIVWQILAIPAFLWILVRNILLPFVKEVQKGNGIRTALWDSYPGNMLIGATLFILFAMADILNALFLHYPHSLNRYGMCIFVLAMAVMLARLYGRLNRELEAKSVLLENIESPAVSLEALFKARRLTDREREVARLMVNGLSNNQIAEQLFISEPAVKFHITNIYRKFKIEGKNSGRAVFLGKLLK
ncbi:hypothetical protein AGMMS50230_16140 [Spirochaetia bacterium]|nr:hypothetical protein AGMMS50230_16140 [Spirochaetia bacterium]